MPNCWIEVNLTAIENNYRALQTLVGESVALTPILKANAYGHGAVEVARSLANIGAPTLAVTRLEEALPIREAGVETPILLLSPALPDEVAELIPQRLTACLSSFEDAQRLSQAAQKQGATARAQLKIDTGMSRFGVTPEETLETAKKIAALPGIELETAWTHFAFAGGAASDTPKVEQQFARFQSAIGPLAQELGLGGFHCANSAALLRFPQMRLSCARAGTVLYGQMPSTLAGQAAAQHNLKLQNTFVAKARVLSVKTIAQGQSVGYGGEWIAPRTTKIATIGIGFADGFATEPQTRTETPFAMLQKTAKQIMRSLKGGAPARYMTINGQKANIVGRIAMQSCALDVTGLDVNVGDEATLALRRTAAGAHLPRVYVR